MPITNRIFKTALIVIVAAILAGSVSCAGYQPANTPISQIITPEPSQNNSVEEFEKRFHIVPTPIDSKFTDAIKEKEAGYMREIVDKMIELTNKERDRAGLKSLKKKEKFTAVADYKVLEMSKENYFEHISPTYGDIDKQFLEFGETAEKIV